MSTTQPKDNARTIQGPEGLDHLFGDPMPDEAHISLYLPVLPGESTIEVRRRLIDLALQAERLLKRSWPKEDVEDLLLSVYDRIKYLSVPEGVRGLAIFRRFDFFKVTTLRTPPPTLSVVADSFHVKPLLHCQATPIDCLALRVYDESVRLDQVTWFGVEKLADFPRDRRGGEPASDLLRIVRALQKDYRVNDRYVALVAEPKDRMALMKAFGHRRRPKFFAVADHEVKELGLQGAICSSLLFYSSRDHQTT